MDLIGVSTLPLATAALRHYDACADCRAALAEIIRLSSVLNAPREQHEVVPAGGWQAFEQRLLRPINDAFPEPDLACTGSGGDAVTSAISRRNVISPGTPGLGLKSAARPMLRHWPARAIAASLLLAATVGILAYEAGSHSQSTPMVSQSAAPEPKPRTISFTPPEVARGAAVFDQVCEVADGKAGWVVVSDGNHDVGVSVSPVADFHKLILIRLAVSRNERLVSTADLAIIPGQSADLTIPSKLGESMHYAITTSSAAPSRLSIYLELHRDELADEAFATLATSVEVQPGQSITAGRLAAGSDAYQLDIAFARPEMRSDRLPKLTG